MSTSDPMRQKKARAKGPGGDSLSSREQHSILQAAYQLRATNIRTLARGELAPLVRLRTLRDQSCNGDDAAGGALRSLSHAQGG